MAPDNVTQCCLIPIRNVILKCIEEVTTSCNISSKKSEIFFCKNKPDDDDNDDVEVSNGQTNSVMSVLSDEEFLKLGLA